MPYRPSYLSPDLLDTASRARSQQQLDDAVSSLKAPSLLEDAVSGIHDIYNRAVQALPTMPIIVSPESDASAIAPPLPVAPPQRPQPASIAPSAVPSGPPSTPTTPDVPTFSADDFRNEGGQSAYRPSAQAAPSGTPQAMPTGQTAGGSNPEKQAIAYQEARASGLDDEGARILIAVTETEGGLEGAIGDQGQSRGGYQFYEGGQMPGFRAWVRQQGIQGDPNDLVHDIRLTTRYAATGYLRRAIEAGRAEGLSGPDLATYVQRHGQVSENPERTGANYARLFGGSAPTAVAPPSATAAPPSPPTSSGSPSPAATGSGGGQITVKHKRSGLETTMSAGSWRDVTDKDQYTIVSGQQPDMLRQSLSDTSGDTMQRMALAESPGLPQDEPSGNPWMNEAPASGIPWLGVSDRDGMDYQTGRSLGESEFSPPGSMEFPVIRPPGSIPEQGRGRPVPAPGPFPNVGTSKFAPDAQEEIDRNLERQMYRQPFGAPTMGPDTATGAEYDPRDADQGAHKSVTRQNLTESDTLPTAYGASGDEAPSITPATPSNSSEQYGPPLSEAGPEQPSALPNPLQAAATAGQEAYSDPLWSTAPAPARAVKIVSDTFQAFGDAAARQVAASLGVTDEELFSILGYPVSGQDIAGFAGSAVADPTNYVGLGAADPLLTTAKGLVRDVAPTAVREGLEAAGRGIRGLGTRVTGALERNAANVAEADARMATSGSTVAPGTLGVVPPEQPRRLRLRSQPPEGEVRIPRAGYATDISPGAEDLVRSASEANAPTEVVRRAEVARKAQDILGADPAAVQRWQSEALAEAPNTRAVRGEALRQAEYVDAENADRAIERLRAAQQRARAAGSPENLAADDRFDVADALLEAAETARAFGISASASTAEGRAAARALGQRRSAITARQAFETAERARQVGQDASFAARDVQRAAASGQVTEEGVRRLRIVRDKLLDAERHGLVGDGAGGRLDAREQRATVAMGTVGINPRPGAGLGTRVASEVGSSLAGGVMGSAAGAALPADTPEERRRNALIGAGAGMVGGPALRRLLPRSRGGALATFGPSPTPEIPNRAVAIGADPSKRYEFRYRVLDLGELVPSNLPSGAPNPAFPRELQPRARERVASQLQIDQIARGLEPDALLTDVGRLDAGPMIVGPDRIVESGNGRTLGLQRAAEQYPEQYQRYVDSLRSNLGEYGLTEDALRNVDRPVLVRERVTSVDRPAFAQEANNAGLLRMSNVEQAAQDAGNLSDDAVTALQVGENDTIASALRKTENRDLVRRWVGTLAENERAGVLDASGQLSAQGYERLTNALLMRTYGAGAGERLARTFIESADPTVRNVQTALMASLPDMARSEALIRGGQRDAGLSIAEDVAAATEMLARLRRDGMPVREYLSQSAMFERELTPLQEYILEFLAGNQRRPSAIRETLKDYAARVENTADPNQVDMFGGQVAAPSREDLWRGAAARSGVDVPEPTPLEARAAVERAPADGARLAAGNAEPVPPAVIDIPPAPRGPAPRSVAPQRPGPVSADLLPHGGPEGSLSVEGAPQPTRRPGPLPENIMPRSGPEGTLAQEGAPTTLAQPTQAERGTLPTGGQAGTLSVEGAPTALARPMAAERGTLPTGGPEGRLDVEGAPPRPANLPPPGDFSTGGPEGTLTLASGRSIKDVAAQIDDVLANPSAPGAAERLHALHQDLREISTQGFSRSSQIRERLQRNGLLRAGLASKDQNVDHLVQALANVDPGKPEEMHAVLQIISKPRLIDRILEYQYVNMLASPITQMVNITANTAQLAGRLFFQNPLEYAYSGGKSTGVGAAFQGAARGFREALPEVKQIMATGTSSRAIENATEMGNYSQVGRELLTEQFGKPGALLHAISTRPLQAMDALFGQMAYASAAEQYAQRSADRLLARGSASVKGMSREAARQHVMANIWDHPEIIERAGKIQDYTLLRSNDASNNGLGIAERELRRVAALGHAPADADGARQALAFAVNNALPFFNVPLNAAKQGIERTAGVPFNVVRGARASMRGESERAAELYAKATIGAGAVTTAAVLAAGENLTGEGPGGSEQAIWEQTHRRNSWRVPGTQTWYSWEGSPLAIPFGMVAGTVQGWSEAKQRAAKQGKTDALDLYGTAALKAGQGAVQGFASQSFIRAMGDQYKLLTGQETGLGTVANQAASNVSRFVPASGMLNFLSNVSDTMVRDPGKPQAFSDLPQNIGAREAMRIPGLREQVDPRLTPYGEPTRNEQFGPAGVLPYYRGSGVAAGDPITQTIEKAGQGAIAAPPEVPAGVTEGVPIPLSMQQQRVFSEAAGKRWRSILESNHVESGRFSDQALDHFRAQARQAGVAAALAAMDPAERREKVRAALGRKAS